jgi:hypothetical protein
MFYHRISPAVCGDLMARAAENRSRSEQKGTMMPSTTLGPCIARDKADSHTSSRWTIVKHRATTLRTTRITPGTGPLSGKQTIIFYNIQSHNK